MKAGAKYRLLGSNPNPDLLNDPYQWHKGAAKRLQLNSASALAKALCNGNTTLCKPDKATVILNAKVDCHGLECSIHEPRTVEAAPNVFFEYVRPPCVNFAFYDNPRTIYRRWHSDKFQCGNPKSLAASTVCCETNRPWKAWRSETFSGERVPLQNATERCSLANKTLCTDAYIPDSDCSDPKNGGCDNTNLFYWSQSNCTLAVKVGLEGSVAIIHQHGVGGTRNSGEYFSSVYISHFHRHVANGTSSLTVSIPLLLAFFQKTMKWFESKDSANAFIFAQLSCYMLTHEPYDFFFCF